MYLIAGLGNPGSKYHLTRHNMGFRVIDELVEKYDIPSGGTRFEAMYGQGIIGGQKVMLIKPLTYMNLSGNAVRKYVDYYKIDPANELIVISDDICLAPGRIRIREKGSAGGQNGLKDIIAKLGTDAFTRIRVGVGSKPEGWDLADFVLSTFGRDEKDAAEDGIGMAAEAVAVAVSEGTAAAMNKFNGAGK